VVSSRLVSLAMAPRLSDGLYIVPGHGETVLVEPSFGSVVTSIRCRDRKTVKLDGSKTTR